jgi:hypothetical protein
MPLHPTYVIEIGEDAVGIVILERGGFRFHAAQDAFRPLEATLYRSVREAERAAAQRARPLAQTSPPRKPHAPARPFPLSGGFDPALLPF